MSTILVTGGAGFIGSHLCEHLMSTGHRVVALDNFNSVYDPAVKRRNLSACVKHRDFTLIEADIRDADAVDRAFQTHRPESVVHLAALAGVRPSIDQPALYADVNVLGTTRLLDAAVKHHATKFIFGSSSSVYGDNNKIPFAESDPVDQPLSPYAATKRAGELIAHTYHHLHGLNVTCLRFFTVFGPRQRPDLAIHKFMRFIAADKPIPVFGDGTTSRDYTFVMDIVAGVAQAVQRCRGFDIINLGSHRPIALWELITAIEKVIGRDAIIDRQPMQPGDVQRTFADLNHARETLDYDPTSDLHDSLAAQWAWLRAELES